MALMPLAIPPGMFRAGTEYQSRGRWYSGSLVRFFSGTIQPVGGWEDATTGTVTGRPCALLGWRPNSNAIARYLAIGTEQKAYVYDGGTLTDITPGDLQTGLATATTTQGYGAGVYGNGNYGDPISGNGGLSPVDAWHFDTWGENLVGTFTPDGRIFEWDLNTANDFAVVSNAPTNCRGLVTSAERMLFALGASGDRRKIAWSNQEDNTTWTATATNTAGDLLLTTDGQIITGERVRSGILIHTTVDAHLVSYIGAPAYYGVDRIADNCGIVSANAKALASGFVVWMGDNGFWIYDGYVKPLPCEVQDYVFSSVNRVQLSKVNAWHNGAWGEIWWHYPSEGSDENDRYVVWNYRENHWTIGAIERTAGIDRGVWDYPICTDSSGNWYDHEKGDTDDGAERTSSVFIESGPTEIAAGDNLVWLNQCVHDESDAVDLVQMTLKTKFTPEGTEYSAGPYTLDASNGYTDIRAQGRAFKVRFEETASGKWKLGTMRFDVVRSSRR